MKHLVSGLLVATMVTAALCLAAVIITLVVSVGPLAWIAMALFAGVTIVAAIIDWKTEKKP